MRLNSINIRNFRVIKSADISFGDQVIGIIGRNGVGKSSIIEAISWALYGNLAARSGKDEIKSNFADPQDNCEVCLSFSINNEKYKVVRKLIGKREHPEVQLFRGESSESVGVKETQKYVAELLGLDWKGFNTSFLARQQELNALSDLQPKKRQDHLAGMLGIERVDKAIISVKEDIRRYKDRISLFESQVGEVNQLEEKIDGLNLKIQELKKKHEKFQAKLALSEKLLKEKSDKYQKIQEAKSKWTGLLAQIKAVEETITNLKKNMLILKEEKANLQKIKENVDKLEKETAGLKELKADFENLKTAKNQYKTTQQLRERIIEQKDKKQKITTELKRLSDDINNFKSQLENIPDNIESLVKQSKVELEGLREKYTNQKASVFTIKSQIETLRQQMKDIDKFGPESVCDRCLRPLGNDLPDIKKHLNEELNNLISKMNSESQKLKELEKAGKDLNTKSNDFEKSANLYKETNIKISSLNRENANYLQQLQDIEVSIEKDNDQLKKSDSVKFDKNQFNKLFERIKELESKQDQLNRGRGKLTRLAVVEEEILNAKSRLKTAEMEHENYRAQLKELSFSEESFQSSKAELEDAQKETDNIKENYFSVNTELKVTEKDLEAEIVRLKQVREIKQKLDESRDRQFYCQKLSHLFSEFREHLVSRIRPTLADFSSRLMEEMTDGRYSLVELDEDYNLRLMDSGSYFGIERFSGGEKDLANLCLRLSISLALTESAGLDRSFIILDEVFGSQDENRKELIIKALVNLKQRFPQILLITHVEDIRDRVDTLIELERQPSGWSEIKIAGQVQN